MRFLIALAAAGSVWAADAASFGPKGNPDDQIRMIWGYTRPQYEDLRAIGFNTFMWSDSTTYDLAKRRVRKNKAEFVRSELARMAEDGMGFCHYLTLNTKEMRAIFPSTNRDGSKDIHSLDVTNPECFEMLMRKANAILDAMPIDDPSYMFVMPTSEVRDHSRPSFTPVQAAAYRAASGRDVPEVVTGRFAPEWRQIDGFPVSRVIPDDYPVYDYYRWFWREGDGWNKLQTEVAREVSRRTGGRVGTTYDPVVRTPPVWGSGGEVTFVNHWTYCYPEPYRVSYAVSEENAMAKGRPGQGVATMIQCIAYRAILAPANAEPPRGAAWAKARPDAAILTMPHDMMREAMWCAYSRRIDGLHHHGARAIIETAETKGKPNRYWMSDPETKNAIRDVNAAVGVPLGPLFRAAPERAPRVAVLESAASTFLARRGTWGGSGGEFDAGLMAVKASLMPSVIYEEEIMRDGLPPSLKVLIMPCCDVLPETVYKKIVAWQLEGGIVAADDTCVPGLLPDVALPQLVRTKDGAKDHEAIAAAAMKLRVALSPFLRPYVETSSLDILGHVRSAGDADLVFAINDRREAGDYVGGWGAVLEKGLPASGVVTVDRKAGAVYDLVRHTPAEFRIREGKTDIPVSLNPCDGSVYLATPRPLAPLTATVSGSVVKVSSPDADVMIPVVVTLPSGRPCSGVVRNGSWSHDFGRPADGAEVLNLADGTRLTAQSH